MNSQQNNGSGNGTVTQAVGTQVVQPYAVRYILLHMLPHMDEWAALWIVQKFGAKALPGAEKAQVRFVERVPQMKVENIEANGFLCLGLGLGDGRWSIDEHCVNVRGSDRLPNECTATLAAKRVGEHADLALKRILDEVLWCDTQSGVRYTHLAELVKLLHRFLKGNSAEVMKWLFPALEAIYMQQVLAIAAQTDEPSLSDFFTDYAKKAEVTNEKLIQSIEKKIADSVENIDRSVTELAYVVRSMYRQGVSKETIYTFCSKVFEAWEFDQVEFDEALVVVDASPTFAVTVKGSEEFELKATVVRGDSLHLLRAANFRGNRLVVIQNSRGQVQIFVNTKTPDFVTLDTLVGMVRLLETAPAKRKVLNWQAIRKTAGEFVVPQWYYFRDARQLFNGSSTHPAVTPTEIHLPAIVDALKHAFHPRLIAKWMHRIGDPLNLFGRKPESDSAVKSAARLVAQVVQSDLGPALDGAPPADTAA
ncbi:MAG: hypothetical protein WCO79_00635 [bacterium]